MVNTRSHTSQHPSGHVPFDSQLSHVENRISSATATFNSLKNMLDSLKPQSEFERGVVTYLDFLANQVREIKSEQVGLREEMLVRNRNMTESVDDLTLSVVKTEQYSRRDTVTVVGLPMPDNENEADLCKKVAETLSVSGQQVVPADLSAVHRNSKSSKVIKGRTVPPSVTVRFSRINQKDNVLRGYKNYDVSQGKRRDTRVYQSLTSHYSALRSCMYEFFNNKNDDNATDIKNHVNLKVKWITYQSPTAGFAVKLDDGTYFSGIHMWYDFVKFIRNKFPDCIVGK